MVDQNRSIAPGRLCSVAVLSSWSSCRMLDIRFSGGQLLPSTIMCVCVWVCGGCHLVCRWKYGGAPQTKTCSEQPTRHTKYKGTRLWLPVMQNDLIWSLRNSAAKNSPLSQSHPRISPNIREVRLIRTSAKSSRSGPCSEDKKHCFHACSLPSCAWCLKTGSDQTTVEAFMKKPNAMDGLSAFVLTMGLICPKTKKTVESRWSWKNHNTRSYN